jgi:hypothetical protein
VLLSAVSPECLLHCLPLLVSQLLRLAVRSLRHAHTHTCRGVAVTQARLHTDKHWEQRVRVPDCTKPSHTGAASSSLSIVALQCMLCVPFTANINHVASACNPPCCHCATHSSCVCVLAQVHQLQAALSLLPLLRCCHTTPLTCTMRDACISMDPFLC